MWNNIEGVKEGAPVGTHFLRLKSRTIRLMINAQMNTSPNTAINPAPNTTAMMPPTIAMNRALINKIANVIIVMYLLLCHSIT